LTASNIAVTEVVGAVMKPEARVAGDGLLAACQGAMSILSGSYDLVLIVAHGKASMGERWAISSWAFDPIYQQPLGLDDLSAAALQAATYLERHRLLPDVLARAATRPAGPTTAEILASPPVASPLRELEITPPADGACALVLAAENLARSASREPIWIRGMGFALEEHYLGDRDLAHPTALREAARRAYELAGISEPKAQIEVAEISDPFAHQRLLWAEALGFCPPGRGVETLTALEGPVLNASGGLLRGVPPFVAGLDRLLEVLAHLRQNPGLGLAQGCWGPAGQGQVVVIVESERS
ncbi:MAG: hypothetical protein ACE5H9_16710, partial [Anaerolineae bacterium]